MAAPVGPVSLADEDPAGDAAVAAPGPPPPIAMPGPGADDAACELWRRDFMERFHAEARQSISVVCQVGLRRDFMERFHAEAAALRSDKEAWDAYQAEAERTFVADGIV